MNRSHELRVASSAPGRTGYLTNASLTSSYERDQEVVQHHGYLYRKCEGTLGRKTKVLHREKNFVLYWCNLKGAQLDLHKIEGLKLKPGDPPPNDIIPPSTLMKTAKLEQMDMEGALVELDYVSQENKDIQKRRKFLFRVLLKNDIEYIMQAPNQSQRTTWVSSLQSVAQNIPMIEEISVGHAIKATRDSIKHTTKHGQRNKRVKSRTTTGSTGEDSDYIEFSTAEAMVAAGGDPRLQALRKRLQAKKELLKHLDRMYTSFLGGNAAAMYDETLMLQQIEPPTFTTASPILSTAPRSQLKRESKKGNYQAVHRKLTLSDSSVKAKSVDGGIDASYESSAGEGVVSEGVIRREAQKEQEEDRRASTGEMSVPATLTSVSPIPPQVKDDVLETELLMDYYLVPGAAWSLIKKGETVQIIGKAKNNTWFRCMALRESKVELDKTPFSFMIKSIINKPARKASRSRELSGITPEMIEEEYAQRDLDETFNSTDTSFIENLNTGSVSPPPLMPRSVPPPTSPRLSTTESEDTFPVPMEMGEDGGAVVAKEPPSVRTGSVEDTLEKPVPVASPDLSGTSSPSFADSDTSANRNSQELTLREDEEVVDKVVTLERRDSYRRATAQGVLDRRESYQRATAEGALVSSGTFTKAQQKPKRLTPNNKEVDTIKRSTSSVEHSSQAAIKLRTNLNMAKPPRAASTASGVFSTSALDKLSKTKDSVFSSLKGFPSHQSGLDNLIDREINSGTYVAPLIGCIPPSALKCFADKDGAEKKEVFQSPLTSPSHSQSDVSASDSGGNNSRPMSNNLDGSEQSDQVPIQPEVVVEQREQNLESVPEQPASVVITQEPVVLREERMSSSGSMKSAGRKSILNSDRFNQSASEDSDAEADRRQAAIFTEYDIIDPQEDLELVKARKKHVRAKSLPPAVNVRVNEPGNSMKQDPEDSGDDSAAESNLDRKPSYLRKGGVSPEPTLQIPPSHSVGSSPLHKVNSATNVSGRVSPRGEQSIGALFQSPSRSSSGRLKKFFTRKSKGSKLTTPEHRPSGRTSPGPSPGMLKKVLLGNKDPFADEEEFSRVRLSSVSGRPVVRKGMGLVFGDESSSESESDEEGEEEEEEEEELRHHDSDTVPDQQESSLAQGPGSLPESPPSPVELEREDKLSASLNQSLLSDVTKHKMLKGSESASTVQKPAVGKLKRSASDHDSLKLKAGQDEEPYLQAGSSHSLKRNMASTLFTKKQRKPRSVTEPQPHSKKNRQSKKKKKNLLANYEVDKEEPASQYNEFDSAIKLSGIIRQPPRGERRFVYLDPSQGKFGFRLQSYGRTREQGKVLQTFVQSVNPGSPSFMAGLYPGDAIVEVNGVNVKYAPVESVVEEIQKGAKIGERIALTVEFVDGVTRLECMRKSDEFKNDIKTRQKRLKELRDNEELLPLTDAGLPSPAHITASELPVWADVPLTFEPREQKFPHNHYLNLMVATHSSAIKALACDVLVMPISSCYKGTQEQDKNVLLQLLRTGGPALLDDLSLAKQCKIGENITTWGHQLPAKYVYHCVFGDLEESLQSCCHNALAEASKEELRTIVFWLDGFASLSVSPHLVIEAVRQWLQQDIKRNIFDRVVFSSKANIALVENFMHTSFPLYPSASRNSFGSFNGTLHEQSSDSSQQDQKQESEMLDISGNTATHETQQEDILYKPDLLQDTGKTAAQDQIKTERQQDQSNNLTNIVENGTANHSQDSKAEDVLDVLDVDITVSEDEKAEHVDDDVSTEDLLDSLQEIQDQNMKTFEELVGKLAMDSAPESSSRLNVSSPQLDLSTSLPSSHATDFRRRRDFFEARSVSPLTRSHHCRSQSTDHILNPDRTESDV